MVGWTLQWQLLPSGTWKARPVPLGDISGRAAVLFPGGSLYEDTSAFLLLEHPPETTGKKFKGNKHTTDVKLNTSACWDTSLSLLSLQRIE